MHEVSSTYTYATVGPIENETSSEAMWAMFQQRHDSNILSLYLYPPGGGVFPYMDYIGMCGPKR